MSAQLATLREPQNRCSEGRAAQPHGRASVLSILLTAIVLLSCGSAAESSTSNTNTHSESNADNSIDNTIYNNVELTLGVATNFRATLEQLVEGFQKQQRGGMFPAIFPTTFRISAASSGVLFAHISNGAPIDVFFSAKTNRTKRQNGESGT